MKMTAYSIRMPTTVLMKIAAALVLFIGIICSAHAATTFLTVKSGQAKEICSCGGHWRVDANGKVWPVTIQVVTPPQNGAVSSKVSSGSRTLKNGQKMTVRLTSVVYQSRKGYVGQDSFTYRHVSADPTDPNNGKEYTVAVTVK
jgi:hypothetical protein